MQHPLAMMSYEVVMANAHGLYDNSITLHPNEHPGYPGFPHCMVTWGQLCPNRILTLLLLLACIVKLLTLKCNKLNMYLLMHLCIIILCYL